LHELAAAYVDRVLAHMLGHILDYRAGEASAAHLDAEIPGISQDGLDDEFRFVCNDLHNSVLNDARSLAPGLQSHDRPEYQGFGPEQRACYGADARAELMAEAIRAYLQNPNYLKAVAPNVAARIRSAVNTNPNLNRVIMFN
jgi:hypothetical protein